LQRSWIESLFSPRDTVVMPLSFFPLQLVCDCHLLLYLPVHPEDLMEVSPHYRSLHHL
jgi:hypothetical protein